jgi:phage shock protein PspC (stress-responsive transcriptional regulator)
MLYFLTAPVDPGAVKAYLHAYMYYGLGLIGVACLAFAGAPIGGVAWAHNDPVKLELMEGRVLPSHCALTLVFCFFFSLAESRYRNTTTFRKWLPAIFLGLAVFLRHRSVWAVIAVGIASFLFVDRKLVRRIVPITAIALFTIIGYALLSGAAVNLIRDQLSKSATNNETWLFRLGMWQALLGGEHTIVSTLLG